jgi:hypothetical protein
MVKEFFANSIKAKFRSKDMQFNLSDSSHSFSVYTQCTVNIMSDDMLLQKSLNKTTADISTFLIKTNDKTRPPSEVFKT